MGTRSLIVVVLLSVACSGGSQQTVGPVGPPVRFLSQNPALEKPVTFRGTISLRDLPDWLTRQNVDFVIADPDRLPDRKLAINVNQKPLRDVLLAIANAVNGSWMSSGDVHALRIHGNPFQYGFPPPTGDGPRAIGNPPKGVDGSPRK